MVGKGLSIVPPGSGADEDEDRLRRLMGPHGGASQSPAPSAPAAPAPTVPAHSAPGAQPHSMPPEPEQRVVYKAPAKETVSVRINPHLKQCLGVVGEGIGWSANRNHDGDGRARCARVDRRLQQRGRWCGNRTSDAADRGSERRRQIKPTSTHVMEARRNVPRLLIMTTELFNLK